MLTASRLLAATSRSNVALQRAFFHFSAPVLVQAGDSIPDLEVLAENSPGNKVNLAKELRGKGLIIGVPAAFSPSCSESHIPGYLKSEALRNAGKVFVVSVNDPFVMKAWGSTLDPSGKSGVRFLGDATAKFTEALDLAFDGSAIFGGNRSKRYAIVIEDGKVKEAHVEPDNTGVNGDSSNCPSMQIRR
ncbi:MAG: Peroxiredoxin-5, mitochondrial [Pleopsidium flavum]|nr:MAG: Peroxiredoxin-5, mitochondrial [Pleopsidium flavum]